MDLCRSVDQADPPLFHQSAQAWDQGMHKTQSADELLKSPANSPNPNFFWAKPGNFGKMGTTFAENTPWMHSLARAQNRLVRYRQEKNDTIKFLGESNKGSDRDR
jgi:hypothetical protein